MLRLSIHILDCRPYYRQGKNKVNISHNISTLSVSIACMYALAWPILFNYWRICLIYLHDLAENKSNYVFSLEMSGLSTKKIPGS